MTSATIRRPLALLRRLGAKPRAERRLLVTAAATQACVIAALRAGLPPIWTFPGARPAPAAARAVQATSGIFGEASTCLSRALTVRCLLGDDSTVVLLGVRSSDGPALDAHAWVECAGGSLLDTVPGEPYTPIARLEGRRWLRA